MAGRRMKSNVEEKGLQGFPFLREDEYTNLILVVEGRRLYTNRCILAYASPVFARRFETECKDKERPELKLMDKKYTDIVELLAYLYPGINKRLNDKTSLRLLPLSEEYKMLTLKDRCEKVLVTCLRESIDPPKGTPPGSRKESIDILLHQCLSVADASQSKVLLEECLKIYANPDISIRDVKVRSDVSDGTKARVYEVRMEGYSKKLANVSMELGKQRKEKSVIKSKLTNSEPLESSTAFGKAFLPLKSGRSYPPPSGMGMGMDDDGPVSPMGSTRTLHGKNISPRRPKQTFSKSIDHHHHEFQTTWFRPISDLPV